MKAIYELKDQTIKTDDLVICYIDKTLNLGGDIELPVSIVNLDGDGIRSFLSDFTESKVESFSFSTLIKGKRVEFSG